MKRLTVKRPDGRWAIANNDNANPMEQMLKIPLVIDRLADYEDTGLEPDMIEATINGQITLQKALEKYTQAEEQGRLEVLPCKVGDTLYDRSGKKAEVEEICIGSNDRSALVCFECDYNCDLCAFNSWRTEHSGENSCDGEYGQAAISLAEIGKTVFLTREEAERALEGGGTL